MQNTKSNTKSTKSTKSDASNTELVHDTSASAPSIELVHDTSASASAPSEPDALDLLAAFSRARSAKPGKAASVTPSASTSTSGATLNLVLPAPPEVDAESFLSEHIATPRRGRAPSTEKVREAPINVFESFAVCQEAYTKGIEFLAQLHTIEAGSGKNPLKSPQINDSGHDAAKFLAWCLEKVSGVRNLVYRFESGELETAVLRGLAPNPFTFTTTKPRGRLPSDGIHITQKASVVMERVGALYSKLLALGKCKEFETKKVESYFDFIVQKTVQQELESWSQGKTLEFYERVVDGTTPLKSTNTFPVNGKEWLERRSAALAAKREAQSTKPKA